MMAFAASRMARDLAEDMVQETLMVLERKYADVDRVEDLLPLSLQVLRFKMMASWRKAARRGENTAVPVDEGRVAYSGDDPEAAAGRAEMLARLQTALKHLEPRCRELFRLKLEDKSFPEIQGILGARSINTIYTWDARCRGRLLELMGGKWEGHRR